MDAVDSPDALRHCQNNRIVRRVLPRLEVVPAHPHNVWELLVSPTEELPVCSVLRDTVLAQRRQPATRLDRVEEHYDPGLRRELDDIVDSGEIGGIRCGKIGGLRERRDSVVRLPVASTTRIALAEQVDPERVEAGRSAIRDERGCLAETDVAD